MKATQLASRIATKASRSQKVREKDGILTPLNPNDCASGLICKDREEKKK